MSAKWTEEIQKARSFFASERGYCERNGCHDGHAVYQAVQHGEALLAIADAAPDLAEALKDVLSWHDFADDMHKPVEVRAAYMRARAALARAGAT